MAVDNKHTFNFIRVVWHITINIISRLEKFGNLSDDYKKNHKVGSWEKKIKQMKYKNKMRTDENFNCIQMCVGFKIGTSYV